MRKAKKRVDAEEDTERLIREKLHTWNTVNLETS